MCQSRHLFFKRGGHAQQTLHHQLRVVNGPHLLKHEVTVIKGDAALVVAHVGCVTQFRCQRWSLFYTRHHLCMQLLKHAGSIWQSQILDRIIALHHLKPEIRHEPFQICKVDQILAERLVDGFLIHVNGVSHARLVIRELGGGVCLGHLPHAFAFVQHGNTVTRFIRFQRVKHGCAIICGADEVSAHLRALAHIAQKVANVGPGFKHVVNCELTRRDVEPVFRFSVFAIHAFAQQRLVLRSVTEHGPHNLFVFFAADARPVFDIQCAVAMHKQRRRHDAEPFAVVQVARARTVQLVLNIVL